MTTEFSLRRIGSDKSLGELLRTRRDELGLSLDETSKRTKIQEQFLKALEEDRFEELPDVYTRGFIRNYAHFLGFDPEELLRPYSRERRLKKVVEAPPHIDRLTLVKPLITSRRLILALVGCLASVFLFTLWHQTAALAKSPTLSVESATTGALTELNGLVDPGSTVTLSGIDIPVSADGKFHLSLILPSEPSKVTLVASSGYNHETKLTKTFAGYDQSALTGVAPVTLTLNALSKPIWVDLHSSKAAVFRGILLEGASHTFQSSGLTLSTEDAGNLSLTITNQKVSSKVIPKLGQIGESKQNLQVLPDTEIQ